MMVRESASVRTVNTCGPSAPGMGSRIGSAPVASRHAPNGMLVPSASSTRRAPGIECLHLAAEAQRDVALAVEGLVDNRHPLLGRVAGEVVLRHVRAIGRHVRLAADERDGTAVAEPPQRYDGSGACGTRTYDDDGFRSLATTRRFGRERGPGHAHVASLDHDLVPGERAHRGRAERLTRAEIEACVMPRAADGVPRAEPFVQRTVVVRARRAQRVDSVRPRSRRSRLVPRRVRGALLLPECSRSRMPWLRSGPLRDGAWPIVHLALSFTPAARIGQRRRANDAAW